MNRRRNRARSGATLKEQAEREALTPDTPVQWRRMIGFLRPYVPRLAIALVATVISAILSLVFPIVIQEVVDSVLTEGDIELLDQVTLLLIGVFLFRSLTTFIQTFYLNWVGERIVTDVRRQLFDHLQHLSLGFYTKIRTGELLSRLSNDVTVMRGVLTGNLNTLIQQSLITIGAVIIMLNLNWRLSLFIIAMIPALIAVGFAFGYYLRRISSEVQEELASATVIAEEVFQGIREVKSFAREPYEVDRYKTGIMRTFDVAIRLLKVRSLFGAVISFFGFGSLAVILWFGGREVLENRLSAGELIAFLVYGLTVAGSFSSLVGLYSQFQEALGATKRVFELMDMSPDVQDAPNATSLTQIDGRVKFEGVSFNYEDDVEVLHDINLDIASGEIIALVGPSGAGKSTTFNLIPRFYDPTDGTITIDGHDLRQVAQASLREQIGIVPQETMLFGGTIRENILYGRLNASEADMIEAAKAANAHDFITETPNGYDTVVGERGVRLSGGQRQRVAIARAILKDPRILLLDEATSSLDNESEHLVQEALGRLMQNRTTIIIAHRLSTISIADRIAVLEHGRITELGTHDDLMARNGLYAKLYEMQFRNTGLEIVETGTFKQL